MDYDESYKKFSSAISNINFLSAHLTDSNVKERENLADNLWDLINDIWISELPQKKELLQKISRHTYSLASDKLCDYLRLDLLQ